MTAGNPKVNRDEFAMLIDEMIYLLKMGVVLVTLEYVIFQNWCKYLWFEIAKKPLNYEVPESRFAS